MSDFDDLADQAIEIGDYLEKPDINDYLYDYEPEWLEVWDAAPVEDMSPGQIEALISTMMDLDWDDWDEAIADMYADYWEWFNENYEGA